MESIPVTTKAQEHKMAEGTKILVLTDNSSHVTYVDFEADAAVPDPAHPDAETTSVRMNTGKNVYQVPEGRDSFSIIGDGDYSIGADYLKSRGGATDPAVNAQLEDHEARISALEAAGAGTQMVEEKPRARQTRDENENKSSHRTDYSARKK
jgi:hypothetical protein